MSHRQVLVNNPSTFQQDGRRSAGFHSVEYFAIVSYYAKGSLVALVVDLQLRVETAGKISLDDIMKAAWQHQIVQGMERTTSWPEWQTTQLFA